MKKNILQNSIVIILSVCCIVISILYIQNLKKQSEPIALRTNEDDIIDEIRKTEFFVEDAIFPFDYIFTLEDSVNISEVVKKGKKLVFFFSEHQCMECIENELRKLNTLAEDIGTNSMLIVAHYSNYRNLELFLRAHDVNIPYFTVNNKEGIFNKIHKPIVFILDKNRLMNSVFSTDIGLPDYSDKFYNLLLPKISW